MLPEGLHHLCDINNWGSNVVYYVPYIGIDYSEGLQGGVKLLLVGESHYEDEGLSDKDSREYTLSNFGQFSSPNHDLSEQKTFFRRVVTLPTLKEGASREEVAKKWRRVAFTNFLQRSVGNKAADRPTTKHWSSGEPALKEIVSQLRPDAVLFVSKSVWNRVQFGRYFETIRIDAERTNRRLWLMPHGGGEALCTWVYHPSRNLETQASRIKVLSELLRLAEKMKSGH